MSMFRIFAIRPPARSLSDAKTFYYRSVDGAWVAAEEGQEMLVELFLGSETQRWVGEVTVEQVDRYQLTKPRCWESHPGGLWKTTQKRSKKELNTIGSCLKQGTGARLGVLTHSHLSYLCRHGQVIQVNSSVNDSFCHLHKLAPMST